MQEEEMQQLKILNERLIQDKKEMEEEFKEILSAIVEHVENEMEVNLGEYKGYGELKAGLIKAKTSKETILLQEKLIEEQEKLLLEKNDTIENLKSRIAKLENSKLGRIQLKWWNMRKRIK